MNPLAVWQQFFNLESTYLPMNPDELEEVCCESETRTISHIGIELDNCRFQSSALNEIFRAAPLADNVVVKLRYNRSLMSHIWVTHPRTGERIRVPNVDPQTAGLNAKQVSAAEKIRRGHQKTTGELIAFSEALRRLREIGQALLRANTQAKRRKGYKLLGITPASLPLHDSPVSEPEAKRIAPAPTIARKEKRLLPTPGCHGESAPAPYPAGPLKTEQPPAPPPSSSKKVSRDDSIHAATQKFVVPIYNVVKRPPDRGFFGEADESTR